MRVRTLISWTVAAVLAGCASKAPLGPAGKAGTSTAADRPLAAFRNPAPGRPEERTATGRYSYVANGATVAQIDPLLAIIEVRVPGSVASVGDAADYLLKRTGYCLMEPATREARAMLGLPLPELHRRLGPMTLREALLALGGQAFELVIDEVYREVGYRVIATRNGNTPQGGV
jgi:type IV pili sensor histidine kinase/response regulator